MEITMRPSDILDVIDSFGGEILVEGDNLRLKIPSHVSDLDVLNLVDKIRLNKSSLVTLLSQQDKKHVEYDLHHSHERLYILSKNNVAYHIRLCA